MVKKMIMALEKKVKTWEEKKISRLLQPGAIVCFFVMALFCAAALVLEQYWLAVAETSITLVLFGLYVMRRSSRERKLRDYLQKMESSLENTSRGEGPLPCVMIQLGDDTIKYANQQFKKLTGYDATMADPYLEDVIPGISTDWLAAGERKAPNDITLGDRRYCVYGTTFRDKQDKSIKIGVLYFSDLTELYLVRDEYVRSRPVVSIILIDNYEELTKNLSESGISSLNAKLNEVIMQWTEGYNGLLRRLERNRFLFIFEKRDLQEAIKGKFSLLEAIHEVTSPSGLPASISMGLGVDGENFEESYNFAALGIDMALSRGGDQAVIKDHYNFTFYGGRNKEADYRSKVRSRITANSLMELIGHSSHVFIMGHKNADLDAVGAAVGINCLCRKKGRKANIVIDLENNVSQKLLEELRSEFLYRDVFISGQEALLMADANSILIVVDTNRPDQVEYMPLLDAIPNVCVVDHHSRAADYISPVVVNLHEPYASSASDLVTEILGYEVEKNDVYPFEAKALLAGICLDTKFFNIRASEWTFEAAAVLRGMGADLIGVKRLLQTDLRDTLDKYEIIKTMRPYRDEIAICPLLTKTTRVLAAQAADELLNVTGITASFVMYPDNDQVIVSARSIGSVNVQKILEALGGGGTAATAGAQVKNGEVQDVLDRLIESIDNFYDK